MKKYSNVIAVLAFVAVLGLGVSAANASGSTPLSGWAWSSTIGWVSFNSNDTGAGGGPYSVSFSTTTSASTGYLTGYAWSPNIGWISFNSGDVSSCGPANSVSGTSVTGWAIALSGSGRADGWNGCIELSGTNHLTNDPSGNSGVTYVLPSGSTPGAFVGYAWGGPVVGWLQFNTGAGGGPNGIIVCDPSISNCGNPNPTGSITGSCAASPSGAINPGTTVTYTATVSGSNGTTLPYKYSWNGGGYSSANTAQVTYNATPPTNEAVAIEDSSSPTPVNSGSVICPSVTVKTTNPGGSGIQLLIGASGGSATMSTYRVNQGNLFGLAWDTKTNLSDSSNYSCSATDSGESQSGWPIWSTNGATVTTVNAVEISNTATNLTVGSAVPVGSYTFTVTCTPNSAGESAGDQPASASATLNVISSTFREQ